MLKICCWVSLASRRKEARLSSKITYVVIYVDKSKYFTQLQKPEAVDLMILNIMLSLRITIHLSTLILENGIFSLQDLDKVSRLGLNYAVSYKYKLVRYL